MSKTEVSGKQVKDGSIELVDLSTDLANTISGKADSGSLAAVATSGSYNDLADQPSIPSVAGLASEAYVDSAVAGKADSASLATVATSGSYSDLINKPSLFSGSYADLTNKPTIPSSLDDLSDVTITSPSTNQILKYNGSAWINSAAPAAGATDLDGLSDVAVSSAAKGQFIVHNGTSFVNSRTIEADAAATVPLTIKGAASQSGNYFQIQNSSATNLVTVDSFGMTTFGGGGWNKHPVAVTGAIDNIGGVGSQGVYAGVTGGYGILRIHGSNGGSLYFGGVGGGIYTAQIQSYGNGLLHYLGYNTVKIAMGDTHASYPGTLHVGAAAAASKGIVVKGAASQTANLFEAQNSAGTIVNFVGATGDAYFTTTNAANIPLAITRPASPTNFGLVVRDSSGNRLFGVGSSPSTGAFAGLGGYIELGSSLYGFTTLGHHTATNSLRVVSGSDTAITFQSPDGGNGIYYFTLARDTTSQGWNISGVNQLNVSGKLGSNLGSTVAGAQIHAKAASALTKGMIIQAAASQTANLFEAQDSSANALVSISSGGTLHAKRYTETVANAFDTSLAPSSGTLTVDTSTGNAVLGTLNASVTTWAFTNVPTDNSKVTKVTVVLDGTDTYTYGDACSVNGNAVTDGVMWSGGSAPTATNNFDIIEFTIVKDSAGTFKVFGVGTTNFS